MPVAWIIDRMKQWTDRPAIAWHYQLYTYLDVLEDIKLWTLEFDSQGVKQGHVVGIEGDYSPKACSLLFALILRRAIIVPITKAVRAHREEFLKTSEAQLVFILDDRDNWQLEKHNREVTNSITKRLVDMNEPGLVLFTSGSTGKHKAVLHNFTKLIEKFKVSRHRMSTINFLLLDHIGGINTLFYTLSNGGTVIVPQNHDPDNICRLIEKYKVELLPTTPTFLNLLLISDVYQNYDLSSLKLITYGTEVMPESLLKNLHQAFPNVQLLQTYGLSELGILRSKSKDSDSLWVKVGGEGFETQVVNGALWVKASSAMIGYLNAPSPFDENGWMNTGDIVDVEGEYFRILGRESDIINVGGQKVYPAEIESVLIEMENVKDANVWGERNPITGNIVVAKIFLEEPEDILSLKRRVRRFCMEKLETFKIPVKIEIEKEIQYNQRIKKARD